MSLNRYIRSHNALLSPVSEHPSAPVMVKLASGGRCDGALRLPVPLLEMIVAVPDGQRHGQHDHSSR